MTEKDTPIPGVKMEYWISCKTHGLQKGLRPFKYYPEWKEIARRQGMPELAGEIWQADCPVCRTTLQVKAIVRK